MNGEHEVVEKKLGMSLDELIAEQKKKQGTRPAGGAKKKPVRRGRGGVGGAGSAAVPLDLRTTLLHLRQPALRVLSRQRRRNPRRRAAAVCWWCPGPSMCPRPTAG
jgi:hypothetical protein